MSNIKDLYVIDIKIIDDRIAELEEWKKDNRQSSEAWVCDNMIDGLENLKKSLKPLEPISQPTLTDTDDDVEQKINIAINYWKTSDGEKQQGIVYGLGLALSHYQQAKSERQPTLPTDEEIKKEAEDFCDRHYTERGKLVENAYYYGAKWMRDKLKSSATSDAMFTKRDMETMYAIGYLNKDKFTMDDLKIDLPFMQEKISLAIKLIKNQSK
jgi:hypothetical protein